MDDGGELYFGTFVIDARGSRLLRDGRALHITPKALQVLQHIARAAGELVTRVELFAAHWPGQIVTDDALTRCIREIRSVLDDDPRRPRYISTVHTRGYRFVWAVNRGGFAESDTQLTQTQDPSQQSRIEGMGASRIFGRDAPLRSLHQAMARGVDGERQLVFITGEAGIGKRTLARHLLQSSENEATQWVAAQCNSASGGEACGVVVDALRKLARTAPANAAHLRTLAPAWAGALGLIPTIDPPALKGRFDALDELLAAISALSDVQPLVLLLEDVHWADASTLLLLERFASSTARCRCVLLATVGSGNGDTPSQLLIDDLVARDLALRVSLEGLDEPAFTAWLRHRDATLTTSLCALLYERTQGNPLFAEAELNTLGIDPQRRLDAERGVLALPATLHAVFDAQLSTLATNERAVLDAAAVCAIPFTPAQVATLLGHTVIEGGLASTRATLARLAANGVFVMRASTPTTHAHPAALNEHTYSLRHARYQQALYAALAPAQRQLMHDRMATLLLARADPPSAELAVHLERAGHTALALQHYFQAGEQALRLHAFTEAVVHLQRALNLLDAEPQPAAGHTQRIALLLQLGRLHLQLDSYCAPRTGELFNRALALSHGDHATPQRVAALHGVRSHHHQRGELDLSAKYETTLIELGDHHQDAALSRWGHVLAAETCFQRAQFAAAEQHLDAARRVQQRITDDPYEAMAWADAEVGARGYEALVLNEQGNGARAVVAAQAGVTHAEHREQPHSLAIALQFAAQVHAARRDYRSVATIATRLAAIAAAHGFEQLGLLAEIYAAAAHIEGAAAADAVTRIRGAMTRLQSRFPHTRLTLAGLHQVYATALAYTARFDEALVTVEEGLALARSIGETVRVPGLLLIRGVITLARGPAFDDVAEAQLRDAQALARQHGMKLWELRAALALVPLGARTGRGAAFKQELAAVHAQFTEDLDSFDHRMAKLLLAM